MKFLLLSPHKWHPPSPPAALDYVAEELEKVGITSEIIDITFTELSEFESLLQKTNYAGVCLTIRNLERTVFSEKLHFPLPSIREVVQMIKKYCDCPFIMGGSGFSILPERVLQFLEADYGIWGGGEQALPLLIRYLFKNEGDLSQIPHLVYRDNGTIRKNSHFPYQKGLLPVKRGYVDYERYFLSGFENFPGFATLETQRGCPHQCVYCVEPAIKGSKVRVKPPDAVTREVDWFLKKGIDHFFLADSEFNADPTAAVSLCKYWIKKGYSKKIKWIAYATPAQFSEELAWLLSESGNLCTMIDFGHVSPTMLKNLGKSYTKRDVKETTSHCQKYCVNFRASLMLGGPGETRETIKEAVEFFKEVRCEVFLVLGVRVFPGTPLGETVRRAGPLIDNPHLYGKVIDNHDLFEPVYYISDKLGEDIFDYLQDLAGTSEQFYTLAPPFRLKSTMYGTFRGVTPEYDTMGSIDRLYVTQEDIQRRRGVP